MRNKLFLSIALAVFFLCNFVFAGDPHYLNKDWYNAEKAGLEKEEVTSIVITSDPEIYEEASMIANDFLIPYWDLDGRGLFAFVRDESQVVICFPEEDKLKLDRFAEACFSFCKYVQNEDYELDEYDERKDHVRPESEIDNEFFETDLLSNLEYIEGFELIDTSEATDMSRLFYGDLKLEFVNLSNMNTKNVENMSHMFDSCFHLLNIDLTTFNTSLVTNMNSMFKSCRQLKSLDLSFWDTGNVNTMSYMFYDCQSLNALDLSFLDTKNLESTRSMFENCKNLKILSISARLGRFGRDLKLSGIWKNMLNGNLYNYGLAENKKMQLSTGLYFRLS